jgi:hypothetical protein
MPENLTDVDEWTDPIVVPSPGDDRNAASVEAAFQGLANRTLNTKNVIGDLYDGAHTWSELQRFDAGMEVYGNISYVVPPIPRIMIPLRDWQPALFNDSMYFYAAGNELSFRGDGSNNITIRGRIRAPHGSSLTEVRVACAPNASDLEVKIYRVTPDKTSAAATAPTELALTAPATIAGGGSAAILEAVLAVNEEINNTTSEYYVEVNGGTSNLASAKIRWADARVAVTHLRVY